MGFKDRNLKIQMKGEDVNLLQKELRDLGYKIPKNEYEISYFGKSTRKEVRRFQKKHNMEQTGIVDKETAKLINKKLEELTLEPLLTNTNLITNLLINNPNLLSQPSSTPHVNQQQFSVRGTVTFSDGKPAVVYTVEARDKDIRSDELLGKQITNKQGYYEIKYTRDKFAKAEKQFADLFIRVLNQNAMEAGKSHVIYNASPNEEINVTIQLDKLGISEYDRFVSELKPIMKEKSDKEIKFENLKENDVEFLNRETGIDIVFISYLIKSHLYSKQHKLLPEIFYAVFRDQSTDDLFRILSLKFPRCESAVRRSIDLQIIPKIPEAKLKSNLTRFKKLAIDESFKGPTDNQQPSIGNIINLAKINQNLKKKFVSLYFENDISDRDFVNSVIDNDAQLKKKDINREVKFVLLANNISGRYLPFVEVIQKKRNLIKTADDLVKLSKDDLQRIVEKAGFPLNTPGRGKEQKRTNYSRALEHAIQRAFPTTFFMNRVLQNDNDENIKLLRGVQALFRNNERVFKNGNIDAELNWKNISANRRRKITSDLEKLNNITNRYKHLGLREVVNDKSLKPNQKLKKIDSSIKNFDTFYKNNKNLSLVDFNFLDKGALSNLNWGDIPNDGRRRLKKQLMAYQRLMNLGGNYDTTSILLENGFDSSNSIINSGFTRFKDITGLDQNTAKIIYANAQHNAVQAAHSVIAAHDVLKGNFSDLQVGYLHSTISEELKTIDGYQDLFGSQNYCECEHCRSIFSPAAYFVDLMHYIETNVSGVPVGNSIHLRTRRPDLWTLKLTCENTHDLIPYLKGINEVLSTFINIKTGRDAFDEISRANESFKQPFNVPRYSIQLYLSHFDLTLVELVEVLGAAEIFVIRETLNLSLEEYRIITTQDTSRIALRYGSHSPLNKFRVQDFLKYTGLKRDELDKLTELKHFQRSHSFDIVKEEISPGSLEFEEFVVRLSVVKLDRVHRFIRLWKKLPWELDELDLVLEWVKESGLSTSTNDRALKLISRLRAIQQKFNISVQELLGIWYRLPIDSENGLYKELFTIHPGEESTITSHLQAGLRVSEVELLLLFKIYSDELGTTDPESLTLTPELTTHLYRHAKTAKLLNLSVEDSVAATNILFGRTKDKIETLDEIEKLIEFVGWQRKSAFTLDNLKFIILGAESTLNKYTINSHDVQSIYDLNSAIESDHVNELIPHLSELFHVNTDITTKVLQIINVRNVDFRNADTRTKVKNLLNKIERALLIIDTLVLNESSLEYLNSSSFSIRRVEKLPDLETLRRICLYKKFYPESDVADSYHTALSNFTPTSGFREDDKPILVNILNTNLVLLNSVSSVLNLSGNALEALEQISNYLTLAELLGVKGETVRNLVSTSFETLQNASGNMIASIRSKYESEDDWNEVSEPFEDKVRDYKRNALVDYLLNTSQSWRFRSTSDIFNYFLLDPEIGDCARTSWVLAGISSLQIYIQRILLNLEQSESGFYKASLDPGAANEWEWRKNYRVWEANRKVFVYPENWIEPELRDNKTPQFRELEDELLQEKISKESAEKAYKKYLGQFSNLAKLQVAGSYFDDDTYTYYFFGKTQSDPPQYYYRTYKQRVNNWSPWDKIDLAINAKYVSAIKFLGKLYIFWVEISSQEKSEIRNGNSIKTGFDQNINFFYSYLDENSDWLPAQRVESFVSKNPVSYGVYQDKRMPDLLRTNFDVKMDYFNNERANFKIYPWKDRKVRFVYLRKKLEAEVVGEPGGIQFLRDMYSEQPYFYELNEYKNILDSIPNRRTYRGNILKLVNQPRYPMNSAIGLVDHNLLQTEAEIDDSLVFFDQNLHRRPLLTSEFSTKIYEPDLTVVNNRFGDVILKLRDQQFLVRNRDLAIIEEESDIVSILYYRDNIRLTTSLTDNLGEKLYIEGLDAFLSLDTQYLREKQLGISFTNFVELMGPFDELSHLDFKGAMGIYYRELFFHIPFIIANHLNAEQKFAEADHWYRKLFNPTANEDQYLNLSTDRNWQYVEFRDLDILKLRDVLNDEDAIELYKKDPFNPHAIARLRLTAYQKTIVMKYIDNLLDWGDHLFAQDTYESINEAMMLYIFALSILGDRPVNLGECRVADESLLTYGNIGPTIDEGSEFLISLENRRFYDLSDNTRKKLLESGISGNNLGNLGVDTNLNTRFFSISEAGSEGSDLLYHYYTGSLGFIGSYLSYVNPIPPISTLEPGDVRSSRSMEVSLVNQSFLAFCIPQNKKFLSYWDRVEDRLFKIRNCMNISGIRRELALFQPPIDPGLLVRARAAGLSLEDIIESLHEPTPNYRFTYLIEKARQFASTVQNFGSALLSALEKKDNEELLQLRSVHELNILKLTKGIKKQQIREAQEQLNSLKETKKNIENRVSYYTDLINNGLTEWEVTQQVSKHTATALKLAESVVHLQAAITYLIPQVGSPFAMKYGGNELGDSGVEFAQWTSSLALIANAVSDSAGLEGTFQRREQEWHLQRKLAEQEFLQMERQIAAAEIREQIAIDDLDIHEKNIDQSKEIYDIYKDKFTNLGLYNYLATSLTRLYREAYNLAYQLAKLAEKAYQFERSDNAFFISNDNWEGSKAGLLAGERLMLQLNLIEKAFIENNSRDYEMTQSFSMLMLDPEALLQLKQTGRCNFKIPEIAFDIFYAGQYMRIMRAVALTIPCVTGPFTNVSCKLTLSKSELRVDPDLASSPLSIPVRNFNSIATSRASNDGGVFELNFRDERYLPFEGAGAISEWILELPSTVRSFDYDSISDVIFTISYTAKDDVLYRENVETNLITTLTTFAGDNGLLRLFSLKHEFPNQFHKLLNPAEGGEQEATFKIGSHHFPYVLKGKDLQINEFKLYLKPKDNEVIDTTSLTVTVNGVSSSTWTDKFENLKESTFGLTGNPIQELNVNAGVDGLDKDVLEDIFILFKYTIA